MKPPNMSYSLNSLKGGEKKGMKKETATGDMKGDTRSLGYSSYEPISALEKLGHSQGSHFLEPLGGLGFASCASRLWQWCCCALPLSLALR